MTENATKKLGIIGGVGPAATARLFVRVIDFTQAEKDQDHLDITVLNRPQIPDRTAYLVDSEKPSFIPSMQEAAKELETQGCEVIIMPCNTAHARFEEISGVLDRAGMLHMPLETACFAREAGIKKCGVLATTGTLYAKVYQEALQAEGVEVVVPEKEQQDLVMDIIYRDIKAGTIPSIHCLDSVFKEFASKGCDGVILGCTELSLLGISAKLRGMQVIDALDILALRAVHECGASVATPGV